MIYSNPTTKSGICEYADSIVSSDLNSYPMTLKTASANRALDGAFSIIIGADGRWQFDDTNQTTMPIATTALVQNQQDYTYDPRFLVITRVELQDQNGNWRRLLPFDQSELPGNITYDYSFHTAQYLPDNISLTDYLKTPGTPIMYDKLGGSLVLYPMPDYNQAASLKVYFQRVMTYFVPTDTIKEPGFAPQFHKYISLCMAWDYAIGHNMVKTTTLRNEILVMEGKIQDFYEYREKDKTHKLSMRAPIKT